MTQGPVYQQARMHCQGRPEVCHPRWGIPYHVSLAPWDKLQAHCHPLVGDGCMDGAAEDLDIIHSWPSMSHVLFSVCLIFSPYLSAFFPFILRASSRVYFRTRLSVIPNPKAIEEYAGLRAEHKSVNTAVRQDTPPTAWETSNAADSDAVPQMMRAGRMRRLTAPHRFKGFASLAV